MCNATKSYESRYDDIGAMKCCRARLFDSNAPSSISCASFAAASISSAVSSTAILARRLYVLSDARLAGKHVGAQVPQPRVDDDGRYRRARPQLPGDADRRDDIRTG